MVFSHKNSSIRMLCLLMILLLMPKQDIQRLGFTWPQGGMLVENPTIIYFCGQNETITWYQAKMQQHLAISGCVVAMCSVQSFAKRVNEISNLSNWLKIVYDFEKNII